LLLSRFRRAIDERKIQVQVAGFGESTRSGPTYDMHPEPFESDPNGPEIPPDDTRKYTVH
jgi:hypothetical protein